MRKLTMSLFLSLFLCILFSLSIAIDTITPTRPLLDGETLVSAGGSFALGFFSPLNSEDRYIGIWYHKVSIQTIVWVANRQSPVIYSPGSLTITNHGTLTIIDNDSTLIWSSDSTTIANPIAQLLDSGNFVVRQAQKNNSVPLAWQSFDHPTDTLLPGMKLGWDLTRGLNRNLTSWVRQTDPSPGSYTLAVDFHGDPQIFLWAGPTWQWRAGPWNGLMLSGIPEMLTVSMITYNFVKNRDEVYYTFNMQDSSIITRLVVNQMGSVQRLVWVEQSKTWNLFWSAPKDHCDLSPCGPFSLCNINMFPICDCLSGFKPQSPANRTLTDGSDGCIRRTQFDCWNGTDGFVKVSGVKLPDTSSSTVHMSLGLDECKAACLKSCSCTAYASANISDSGSGCIIWTSELIDIRLYAFGGQDLYVRLAAADLANLDNGGESGDSLVHSSINATTTAAIVVPVVLASVILVWIGHRLWRNKKKRKLRFRAVSGTISFSNLYSHEGPGNEDLELPMFELCTIAAATDNFSIRNQLGEGGFGPVFKGTLGGQEIAVKRLAKSSIQGVQEFKNEIVLIARLQHRNLVRLLGCCIEGEERILVYEYLPNKSLDFFLFDNMKGTLLDWQTRYNIIMGIARGLLYLHQDSRFRIIHRDLKASNILLDKEMKPKISDFGMARIFWGDGTEVSTRKIVGTYGYMSPEYAMDGILSVKSDVFSFGVLVLEIISGKKNRGVYLSNPEVNLLGLAWTLWKEGNGLHLVDELMGYSLPMAEVLRCIKVGLLCVQEWPEDRPTMSSVVSMLSSECTLLSQPKQPGFVSTRVAFNSDSSTSKQGSSTYSSSTGKQTSSSGTDSIVTRLEARCKQLSQ